MRAPDSSLHTYSFGPVAVQLFLPAAAALRESYAPGKQPAPYWARLWPAAIALARFIAAHPDLVKGRRVLELAAGLGLPGMVAAHWAASVIISDYAPEAVALMRAAIRQNGLSHAEARLLDWNALPDGLEAEVLLLSDINYDPTAFEVLYGVLIGFLEKGTTILLATPQRLLAKPFIGRLLPYCLRQEEAEVPDGAGAAYISILVLGRHG